MNYTKENIILALAVIGSLVFLIVGFKPGKRVNFFAPSDKPKKLGPNVKIISFLILMMIFFIITMYILYISNKS
jgi:hypothetical protein